ncbi:hypothetical protein SPBR_01449 [Sporothrix brasiliensis 5110]|uniref:Uncharacterized protein n=1 Tax=Sporothrix brasiliensis 5110 TaxID=1398154 RepID=A0A0C2EY10_9PEZI|nr:uncharacterized protein SPBR_01449 [Sporothrix brasiliensis 5110]KIH91579.1 hypothetical protein SPBR_01449 [Sporothrix brasiliensis 5110]
MAALTEADVVTAPRPSSFSGTSSASYLDELQLQQLQQLQPQQRPSQQQQRPHTSRFVEGSMNDRASRAPPVSYLGGIGGSNDRGSRTRSRSRDRGDGGREDPYAHREYQTSTRRSLQMARPSLSAFRSSNSATASAGTSASITSTDTADTAVTSSTTASTSSSLRRPRSFLGPIWDGVTKRLHRRTRSTVEADMAKKREQEQELQQQQHQDHMQARGPTPATATLPGDMPSGDRLSPEEVMANYQQLMQSGFFSKRAIPATRQGLTSRGGTSNGTDSGAPIGTEVHAACPTRPPPPPPPPPKSAPWINGTPLSPVAPSPAGTATITLTPRGTKRVRAPADEGEDVDGRHDAAVEKPTGSAVRSSTDVTSGSPTRNSPRKISKKLRKAPSIRSTPGQDGSVRSLRSMHKAAAAAAAAAEAEYYETICKQPSFDYSAYDSAASTTRITRSKSGQAPVRVHQPLPPLPVSAAAAVATGGDKRIVSKKRKETSRTASSEEERSSFYNHKSAVKPSGCRSEAPQETQRKRRSQTAAAVVHQDRQGRTTGDAMILDDDRSRAQKEKRNDDTLRPEPSTHSHRPMDALSPTTASRGGGLRNSSDNGRAALTTLSPSSSQKKQLQQSQPRKQTERPEPPISFHYPQRVRVRRPMQAQVVEVTAAPMLSANARSKPQINGKSLLFREEDTENQVPIWQD